MAKNLPGDLVAEWEALRPPANEHPDVVDSKWIAGGGWCAPSEVDYSLITPILNANGRPALELKMDTLYG